MLLPHFRHFLTSLLLLTPVAILASPASPPSNPSTLPHRSALLIVDMQNCFSPTGSLAVPSFLSIVPVINRLHSLPLFSLVALSQDYHPAQHVSFAATWVDGVPFSTRELQYDSDSRLCHQSSLPSNLTRRCSPSTPLTAINQTLWPVHCVAGQDDSAFHPSLLHWPSDLVVRKGQSAAIDSYSAFSDVIASHRTPLPATLHHRHIRRLYVAGVALEVCVHASVMDAVAEGLEVLVVEDAVAGINPKAIADTRAEMEAAGVQFVHSSDVPGWADAAVEAVLERTLEVEVAVQ